MLEEELYEPMRRWLEQYMKDNYRGYEIITIDCHSSRLDRVLAKYDVINEQSNGVDIQIDVLGIAKKDTKAKLHAIIRIVISAIIMYWIRRECAFFIS